MCKAGHAEERAAFHSAPQLQLRFRSLRKINCSLQNALVEKGAWWVAGWYAGLALKAQAPPFATPPTPLPQPPQNQLQLANCRKSCAVGCDVACGVGA